MKVILTFLLLIVAMAGSAQQKAPLIRVEALRLADSKYQFIDKEHKTPVNELLWIEAEPFSNGFAKVYDNNGWTFVNGQGIPVSNTRYEDVRNFVNHMAAVKHDSQWGFIDESGNEVISPMFDFVYDFAENLAAVYYEKEWRFINRKGSFVSNADHDWLSHNQELIKRKYSLSKPFESNRTGNNKADVFQLPTPVKPGPEVIQTGGCPPNISFESGSFANWSCFIGSTACVGGVNTTTLNASAPIANRHTLITRATPSALDPWGFFSTNPPDGSNFCVRLGNAINGSQAERISYSVTVPANATNFSITYRYAVVFQDPSHLFCQQPRFSAKLFDPSTNSYLPCGTYEYVSTSSIPGFFNSPLDPNVKYKPWAEAFINLTPYAGKTLNLEFTTCDCTLGAHWGYAYLDVDDNCNLTADIQYDCTPPHITTLIAPSGFQAYKWWDFNFSNVLGTSQTLVLNPGPPSGTNFWVEVFPYTGFGCRDTLPVTITVSYPVANFPVPAAQCLSGNNFTFTSTSILATGFFTSYDWNFGDGNTGSGLTINHSYSSPGSYSVKLVVTTNIGCKDSITQVITVHPQPIASFTQPANQCFRNNSFSFTSNSTVSTGSIISHLWYFGDGNTGNGITVSHSYAVAGTYTVKLVVTTNNNCKDSITHTVTVYPQPFAQFTQPTAQCFRGNSFSFTSISTVSSGSIISHDWDFGDGNTGSGLTVIHSYSAPGSYSVKLVVTTNNGCKDSLTRVITVYPQPVANFTQPAGQCFSGNNFTFTSTSTVSGGTIISHLWNYGDGRTGSGVTVSHSYAVVGTFNVKLVVTTNDGCLDSITHAVTVYPQPVAVSNQPAAQCFGGNNFSFISSSIVTGGTIISHNWNFGDGFTASGVNVSHSYAVAGTYTVKLVVTTDNGCKDSVNKIIIVYADPIVNIISDRPLTFCAGDSLHLLSNSLAGSGSITGLQWFIGGTPIPGAIGMMITVFQSGNYQLEVTNSNGCIKRSAVVPVIVHPLPVGNLILPNSNFICQGSPVILNVTGAGSTFQWFMNGVLIPGATGPNYAASQTGLYSVQMTSPQGCKNFASGSVNLTLLKKPVPGFNYPVYCAGIPINFTNLSDTSASGPVNWLWDFGDGTQSALFNPSHIYARGTNYSVTLRITPVNCPNLITSLTKVVPVEDPRPGIRYPAINAINNTNTQLQARNFGNQYLWTPSTGLTNPQIPNPVYNYNQQTEYVIRIKTDAGCLTYDTQLVRRFRRIDIQVPKAFTPNGDGHNDKLDVFLIGIIELKFFKVFNRWGQLMFETKDALQLWDGTYHGEKQPLETYVWIAEGIGYDGSTIIRRGQTVLIR